MPLETSEKLEFLSDIAAAAERLSGLLDEFEALQGDSKGAAGPLHPAQLTPLQPATMNRV